MSILTIALLQLCPGDSLAENQAKGLAACRKAKELGADIALFPEMWSNGYRLHNRPLGQWKAEAIPADGPYGAAFAALAQELSLAIGVTLLEQSPQGPRNSLLLFDRFGRQQFCYAKVHTCDFDVEQNRLAQLRGRAYENMLAIATCNYPQGVPDCNGGSTLFDGVAFSDDCPISRDCCLLQAGPEEGIYLARLDLELLRNYRRVEVQGNAYRRPKKYGLLLAEEIQEPFLREDYRG